MFDNNDMKKIFFSLFAIFFFTQPVFIYGVSESSPSSSRPRKSCSIPGTVVQWAADYCFYKAGTDDPASPEVNECLAKQLNQHKDQKLPDCKAKRRYKRKMCRLMKDRFDGSVKKCMRDPNFSGPTVKR